jgi:dihydrodipicolinate synthase/N-acetylneuraminate lyase
MNLAVLAKSVVSVPPLARRADGAICLEANGVIMEHIAAGGVTTFLFGGNALVHHWPMSRYADWLDMLVLQAPSGSLVLPSVGPDGGKLADQADILKSRDIRAALLLPLAKPFTISGAKKMLKSFHSQCGTQLIIYIKSDGYLPAPDLAELVEAGVVLAVKYAVPSELGESDLYLDSIIDAIGSERIISGFGEPPAIPHMIEQSLAGFTSGCVCISPALSAAIFSALKSGERGTAETLMKPMLPLEMLRNEINEIRVLHAAVAAAGIAATGPILMPSAPVPRSREAEIEAAAKSLLAAEMEFRARQSAPQAGCR